MRDAEDLTARVFYRALAHLPDFNQTGAPFVAWLYRIAHNLVANWHPDNTRHPEVPLDLYLQSPVHEGTPHTEAERAEAESKTVGSNSRPPGRPSATAPAQVCRWPVEPGNRQIVGAQ